MPSLAIHCRFFARYAELLGTERSTITLPAGATVTDALAALRRELPAAQRLPVRPMVAVNRAHVPHGHRLADGDELALLPPVAGG